MHSNLDSACHVDRWIMLHANGHVVDPVRETHSCIILVGMLQDRTTTLISNPITPLQEATVNVHELVFSFVTVFSPTGVLVAVQILF